MSQMPSIDYRCTRCGARHIYQLVPLEARPTEDEVRAIPHEIPSIDLRCSRCGASQTYKLVPDGVSRAVGDHRHGDERVNADTSFEDVTRGRKVGAEPYEDPTQGREIGHAPYADPTLAR